MDSTKTQPFVCRINSEILEHVGALLAKGPPYPEDLVCPICREGVTLIPPNRQRTRGGYIRHRSGQDCARRPRESEAHETAKNALIRVLNRTHAPYLTFETPEGKIYVRPLEWDRALPEVTPPGDRIAIGYSSRVDIGLIHGGRLVFALEVCEENPVSSTKAAAFQAAGIPWLEVKASKILSAPDAIWGSLRHPLPRNTGWDPVLVMLSPLFPPGTALP